MKPPTNLTRIIGGRRYNVATATLIAGDDWWDGHNHERGGLQRFLYRTARGAWFFADLSQWTGTARQAIIPATQDEAIEFFESVAAHDADCCRVTYETAFPGIEIPEA